MNTDTVKFVNPLTLKRVVNAMNPSPVLYECTINSER